MTGEGESTVCYAATGRQHEGQESQEEELSRRGEQEQKEDEDQEAIKSEQEQAQKQKSKSKSKSSKPQETNVFAVLVGNKVVLRCFPAKSARPFFLMFLSHANFVFVFVCVSVVHDV